MMRVPYLIDLKEFKKKNNMRSARAERIRREREAIKRQEQRQQERKMAQFRKNCAYRDEL